MWEGGGYDGYGGHEEGYGEDGEYGEGGEEGEGGMSMSMLEEVLALRLQVGGCGGGCDNSCDSGSSMGGGSAVCRVLAGAHAVLL